MLWLTKESAEQDAMPKNVDPKLTTRMLEAKDQEVVSVCKPISEKPKPKVEPPKEAEVSLNSGLNMNPSSRAYALLRF